MLLTYVNDCVSIFSDILPVHKMCNVMFDEYRHSFANGHSVNCRQRFDLIFYVL